MTEGILDSLYREESARRVAEMRSALNDLVKSAAPFTGNDAFSLANQALKGAARAVEFEAAIRMTEAIEVFLDGLAREGEPPGRNAVTKLGQALGFLEKLGSPSRADAEDFARREKGALADLFETLTGDGEKTRATLSAAIPPATLELFKLECEVHGGTLTDGLLLLEKDPGRIEVIDRLMRAAHSIKGAARVVGLDAAVELAHTMEDVFLRIQKGTASLTPDDVEELLAAKDLLIQMTIVPSSAEVPGFRSLMRRLRFLGGARGHERSTSDSEPLASPSGAPSLVATVPEAKPVGEAGMERSLRVTATRLSRLVALASESLVEVRRLSPLVALTHRVRVRQAGLSDLLNDIHQLLGAPNQESLVGGRIGELRGRITECRGLVNEWISEFEERTRRSEDLTLRLFREATASRMRPLSDGFSGFPRLVRDLARRLGKKADLVIDGQDQQIDREILERIEAPITHLLRNAIDHGIEMPDERLILQKPERGKIELRARQKAGMLEVTVSDDGRGIDPEKVRAKVVERGLLTLERAAALSNPQLLDFLFAPGFSTAREVTEVSGRGVGLDVVMSVLREVGGAVHALSEPGQGAVFHLRVPVSRSVLRAVIVSIAGEPYAFPLTRVDRQVLASREQIQTSEDHPFIFVEGQTVALVSANELLELPGGELAGDLLSVVIVSERSHAFGFVVDSFLGELDLVVRPLDPRLGRVSDVSAAALLPDGSPVLILDAEDMVRSVPRLNRRFKAPEPRTSVPTKKRILVVDDVASVRELVREMLLRQGYEVSVEADGADGWAAVREGQFDLVITDVDMPRLDGLTLTRSIKRDPGLAELPVMIVSYRDSEGDRNVGLAAGASVYLPKSSFESDGLLAAVRDLIGDASETGKGRV
jgi:two-component system sensor histidine kinase and response regulator WspE